eukprot:193302-Pleurochrysis_carterae.AAC.6
MMLVHTARLLGESAQPRGVPSTAMQGEKRLEPTQHNLQATPSRPGYEHEVLKSSSTPSRSMLPIAIEIKTPKYAFIGNPCFAVSVAFFIRAAVPQLPARRRHCSRRRVGAAAW